MNKNLAFFLIAAMSTGALGCNRIDELTSGSGSSPAGDGGAPTSIADVVQARFQSKLDSSMTQAEKDLLASDLRAMLNYQISAQDGGWYSKIFGGTDIGSTLGYLDDRISYLFPASAEVQLGTLRRQDSRREDNQVVTVAVNLSANLWYTQLAATEPVFLRFQGDHAVTIPSTRVGVVQLGNAYDQSAQSHGGHDAMSPIFRTAVLIHEARHSDCKDGIGPSDLARIRHQQEPQNQSCSFAHSKCGPAFIGPDGRAMRDDHGRVLRNPYVGNYACDSMPWGAYAVQAVYTGAIAKTCANCSEDEKQEALMISADSASRLSQILQPMMQGQLGDPDMASQGLVGGAN